MRPVNTDRLVRQWLKEDLLPFPLRWLSPAEMRANARARREGAIKAAQTELGRA
jgi:hypothetical protein